MAAKAKTKSTAKKKATKKSVVKAGVDGRSLRTKRTVTPAERRLGWSGLSEEELTRQGSTLLAWLVHTANERGLQMKELAEKLGVTYGYIAQLRSGIRDITKISDEFSEACADFLNTTKMAVWIASGRIKAEDFYEEPDTLPTYLESALHFIQKDVEWGAFLPPSVFKADIATQQFIVLAYERATGRNLVPTKLNIAEILEDYKKVSGE